MPLSVEAPCDEAPGDLVDTDEAARITGLERHRVGDPAGYWLTLAQAAELLGMTRQAAYTLPLPVRQTARGHRVVRRIDIEQAARVRAFHAMVRRRHPTVD